MMQLTILLSLLSRLFVLSRIMYLEPRGDIDSEGRNRN